MLSTEDVSGAYKFLSRHFINNKQYEEASKYAQKCCDYSEVTIATFCDYSDVTIATWSDFS